MKKWFTGLNTLLGLAALAALTVLLIVLFSRAKNPVQVGQVTSPVETPVLTIPPESELVFQSPVDTPTLLPTPTPWPTVTPSPTPTIPPVPTHIPTPVVTPIPTAVPPIIPEAVGKVQQPFWFIYWQDNQIWRVDSQGRERELLFDTYKQLGQWLTGIPNPYKDTDCCLIGQRVSVSPDGQKLALVVVDKIKGSKGDKFTFSVYVFNILTNNLKRLGDGTQAIWSPDSEHIAFLNDEDLWIADLKTGYIYQQIAAHKDPNIHIGEFAWSPDGTQIAYLYDFGMQRLPAIWIISTQEKASPYQLFSSKEEYPVYGITWSPNGQRIFYLSLEGTRDVRYESSIQNLWAVSLATGRQEQLTCEMEVQSYGISPDHQWVFIAGYPLYELNKEDYDRDLWILSIEGGDLRRVTADQGDIAIKGWSPDGTRLVIWRAEAKPLLLSLVDRTTTVIDFELGFNYQVGGSK